MKRKKRTIIAVITCLVLMVGLFPAKAGAGETEYPISYTAGAGCKTVSGPAEAADGETVIVTVTPEEDCQPGSFSGNVNVSYTDANEEIKTMEAEQDGSDPTKFTFTMPSAAAEVTAQIRKKPDPKDAVTVEGDSFGDDDIIALGAPAEGSKGSMTVKINWLDYDGTEISPGSSSLPDKVALTLQKMTGNDASTGRDVSAAEYAYDLTRNAEKSLTGPWTASWTDLPYIEGYNYTVRFAASEDYEFVTENQEWDLSGDVARWDTTLVLQLKEPENINITAELLCYPMEGKTLNVHALPNRISVTLYQEDGSGGLTRAKDVKGNELDPVTFSINSRYNSITESNEYYWSGVFKNVPNKENITYVPKADGLPAYFREDSNTVTGKTKADGIKVKVVYTYLGRYVVNKVDADTGDEVNGAMIALYEKDDAGNLTPIERWVSVSGETHDFGDKFEAGHNYVLREITAPTGYGKVTTDIEISVSADGELTSSLPPSVQEDGTSVYLIKDNAIRFNVNKTDAANGEELDGAVLSVYEIDAAGNEKMIDSCTSTGGRTYDFGNNLEAGKSYVLREETAPTGYKKITTDIAFTVNEDGTITTDLPKTTDSEGNDVYLVQDSKLTVKVSKVDVADGKKIAGAKVQLFDKINQLVDEWTSSDTEVYVIENIQAGVTYTLKETIAPKGYEITSDTKFSIDEEGNITSSGTVSDEGVILIEDAKTSVKVSKVDVADGKEVAGATIQVIDSTGKVVDEWTSSDKEVHTITGLETGVTYTLKETAAPDGYTIAAETTFSLDAEGNVTSPGTVTTDGVLLVEDAKTKVKVSKIDIADGEELEGATLQILDENGDLVIGWVSGTEATEIEGLKTGVKYTLKETKAPGGYAIAAETTFTIDKTGKVTTTGKKTTDEEGKTILLVENQKKTENANVKISKTDIADGKELAGATIQILDKDGNVVEIDGKKLEWVSGTEAKEIEGLKTGVTYTLKETVAPDGYTIASETTFTIDETGKVTSTGTITEDGVMLVEDAKTKVKVSKTDIADGKELAGAKIQILDKDGNVVEIDGKKLEWVSGTEAKEIEGLKTGVEYTLKETVAPEGYTIASETTFSIDETGKVTSTGTVTEDDVMLVEDAKTKVKVSKTDIADGRDLAGATIQILDKDGNVVEIDGKKLEWVSGTEAKEIEGLKTGVTYTLKETVAPAGYTIASQTTFTIDETGKVTSTGTVTEDGVLLIEDAKTKVTVSIIDRNGKVIENAGLQIVDKNGKVIAGWTSGKDAHTIEGLNPGEYILQETAAPSGYKKASPIAFTLEADGTVRVNGKTVEKITMTSENAPAENKTTPGPGNASAKNGNASAKTGDTNNVLLFVMMLAISVSVLVGMAAKRKKG